ncbi:MAG: calcium-binding protein, partial [bacterium]
PLPTPLTVSANSTVLVNLSAKLRSDDPEGLTGFLPPGLENLTRAEIKRKIINHQMDPGDGLSSLYIDVFFNFNLDPGDVFQCPHGANTAWLLGRDDQDDFTVAYNWYDFTVTNAFSTLTVPITTHTSETERAVLDGSPISAFIEVIPNCFLVECPSTPGTGGTSGPPTVVWTTDPAPGEIFVIDELEKVGKMTLDFPSPVPEGAVVAFAVIMKEADSGRPLSTETKRFALDTEPPVISSFNFIEDGMGNLLASATVLDEAASIQFVELLASRDGGLSFAGFPMDWKSGDFINPTLFQTTFGPLAPGETIFKISAVDEAGNSSETSPHVFEGPPAEPPSCATAAPTEGCTVNGVPHQPCAGTGGSDTILGTRGDDVIHGLDGNDRINGLSGDDLICGGEGHDSLRGKKGRDRLFGGPGPDFLRGGSGNDELFGEAGDDRLQGRRGDDALDGGEAFDRCDGGSNGKVGDSAVNCERVINVEITDSARHTSGTAR